MSDFCRQCGAVLPAGAAFCSACGTPTGETTNDASAASPPNAPYGQAVRDIGARGTTASSAANTGGFPAPNPAMYLRDDRSLFDYLIMPWRRSFDFSGRSGRKEYWAFAIPVLLAYTLLFGILIWAYFNAVHHGNADVETNINVVVISATTGLWVVTLIPGTALAIRRLHDCDQSGWVYLAIVALQLVLALFAAIGLIVLGCMKGTYGPNSYGPDPRDSGPGDVFR